MMKEAVAKILSEAGVSEAESIAEKIAQALSGEYVPRARLNEVIEQRKAIEAELKERDKQLSELKRAAGESEELRRRIEELQAENKKRIEEYEQKMKELAVTGEIKARARDAHDPDLVAQLIDRSKIAWSEDGRPVGIEELLKELREQRPYLFRVQEPAPAVKGARPLEGVAPEPTDEVKSTIERLILGG